MTDKPKVLVVDDNPDILILLRTNLRATGFEPVEAANGEVALEKIESEHPDAVLLDLMMPVMDGWTVLEELQGRDFRPPVIVLSAADASANVERAKGLGVAAYVTKPFDVMALVGLVREVVQRSSRSGVPTSDPPRVETA